MFVPAIKIVLRKFVIYFCAGGETQQLEEELRQKLGHSALFVAGITLFAFCTFVSVYCFVHKRERKKKKVSPKEQKTNKQCTGIGYVETGSNITAVQTVDATTASYFNHGFVYDDSDYEF